MAIELATQFLPYVDEQFKAESKRQVITNNDFEFTGAHSVKVYKVTTSAMNDYDREGTGANHSRYGQIHGLDATTEEFTLKKLLSVNGISLQITTILMFSLPRNVRYQ